MIAEFLEFQEFIFPYLSEDVRNKIIRQSCFAIGCYEGEIPCGIVVAENIAPGKLLILSFFVKPEFEDRKSAALL